MSRFLNLKKLVIDALLANDEVCGALLAKEIGCVPASANSALRELRKYLASRPAPDEPGKNRIYYRVVDRDGLIALSKEKRVGNNGTTSGTLAPKHISFDALLGIWGIEMPTSCTLPSVVHRMEVAEDELFEEAA